jgi:ABC-type xylose transport system permease subunit
MMDWLQLSRQRFGTMKNMFSSGKIQLIDALPVVALVVLLVVFGITSGGMLFSSFNIQSVIRDSIPVILGGDVMSALSWLPWPC